MGELIEAAPPALAAYSLQLRYLLLDVWALNVLDATTLDEVFAQRDA